VCLRKVLPLVVVDVPDRFDRVWERNTVQYAWRALVEDVVGAGGEVGEVDLWTSAKEDVGVL